MRAVSSEKSSCWLAVPQGCRSTEQGAEGVLCPLGCGQKCAPAVCAVEKIPILCSLLLDFKEVSVLTSESVGFCGHGLEGHPNKVKSSCYSASLDKLWFLTVDTGVGASMWNMWGALHFQAVKQAFCWAPEPLLCFLLCYEWLQVIEWSSVNLEFTELQSWKGLTRITESSF